MKAYKFLFVLMSFVALQACNAQSSNKQSDLKAIASQKNTLILDVRTVQEFNDGHYDGSVNIPLQVLTDSLESLRKYDHIVTICRSGNRSEKAKTILKENGFKNVTNGGGWQAFKELMEK